MGRLSLPLPDLLKSHPGPADLRWGLGFCISNQLPGNAAAAARGPHLELSVGREVGLSVFELASAPEWLYAWASES